MGTQNMIIATDRFSPEIKRGDMYVWGSGEINLVTMILIIISFTNRWWKSKRESGEKEWKAPYLWYRLGLLFEFFPVNRFGGKTEGKTCWCWWCSLFLTSFTPTRT